MSLAALGLDNRARVNHTLDDWVRQPDLSARLVRFDDEYLRGLGQIDIETRAVFVRLLGTGQRGRDDGA